MKKNVWQMLDSFLCMQEDLEKDNGKSLVLVLTKWYSIKEDSREGIWDKIAAKMLLEFAESGCPIFPATTPLSRGHFKTTKDVVNCRYAMQPTRKGILSHNCFCKPAQLLRSSRREV